MKDRNQRLLRWNLTLQEYNLQICHIRGKDNLIADALSRRFLIRTDILQLCCNENISL